MMDEPRFAQPIPNVTVAVGRDANLPCVVENLGSYKVRKKNMQRNKEEEKKISKHEYAYDIVLAF